MEARAISTPAFFRISGHNILWSKSDLRAFSKAIPLPWWEGIKSRWEKYIASHKRQMEFYLRFTLGPPTFIPFFFTQN